MRNLKGSVLALLAPLALAYCSDKAIGNIIVPVGSSAVAIEDQCDSTTFNQAPPNGLGAGNCVHAGTVTFAEFETELGATGSVAEWLFSPSSFSMTAGGTITATNDGGQMHTFTPVVAFGGGTVPGNNNGEAEIPECAATTSADDIAPGASVTTPVLLSGVHLYQCCIHPWMRTTVTIP